MDEASGFKHRSSENLHSIVWTAGAARNGCKETKNDWLSIRKGSLNSYLYKLVPILNQRVKGQQGKFARIHFV